MKLLALACSSLIAAYSTSAPLVSTNPELLRIGEKPEGYPKTYLQQIDGHCQQVTESWREREFRGQTIWLKDVSEKTVDHGGYCWFLCSRIWSGIRSAIYRTASP